MLYLIQKQKSNEIINCDGAGAGPVEVHEVQG